MVWAHQPTAMRQLAQDGKLTADTVSIALLKMTQDIDKDFKQLPITMGKAFTNIKTDLSKLSQNLIKQAESQRHYLMLWLIYQMTCTNIQGRCLLL